MERARSPSVDYMNLYLFSVYFVLVFVQFICVLDLIVCMLASDNIVINKNMETIYLFLDISSPNLNKYVLLFLFFAVFFSVNYFDGIAIIFLGIRDSINDEIAINNRAILILCFRIHHPKLFL